MQDIGATTVTNVLIKAYSKSIAHTKGREPLSAIGVSQLKIIVLLTAVIGSAGVGAVVHGGAPKVNIPATAALVRETVHLLCLNRRDYSGDFVKERQSGTASAPSGASRRNCGIMKRYIL